MTVYLGGKCCYIKDSFKKRKTEIAVFGRSEVRWIPKQNTKNRHHFYFICHKINKRLPRRDKEQNPFGFLDRTYPLAV